MTTTFTASTLPALISVTFAMRGESAADLVIHTLNASPLHTTILHESEDAGVYELQGSVKSQVIHVADKESLTILVRESSDIIACAVLEVNCVSIETVGVLLIPRCTSNIIVDQTEDNVLVDDFTIQPLDDRLAETVFAEHLEVR